ncbi:MAG: type II toxin-antitoxin system VapC family toxin [Niabella sp.]|nr:type II toxin-antitoxin system VapC family toxin [Niabella sp.]
MTGNKYLLDTNIIVEVFGGDKELAEKIDKLSVIYISSIVAGELYTGINRVKNKSRHLKKFEDFLQICTILNADQTTAVHYGIIMAALYKKGKPIPTNDIWIAAIAQQHNLTLITRDKHFTEIEGLKTKVW